MVRRLWETVHLAATLVAPWVLAVWFYLPRRQTQTLPDEAHLVFVFHSVAAVVAGVLLCSSAMVRVRGPAVAASIPFTIFWGLALAAALYEVHEFGVPFRCDVELCMPSFGLFLTALPFAFLVTLGVAGSLAFHHARNKHQAPLARSRTADERGTSSATTKPAA